MDYLHKAIFYKRKYSNLELKKIYIRKEKEVGEPRKLLGRYVLLKSPLAVISGHQTPQLTLTTDLDSEHCP